MIIQFREMKEIIVKTNKNGMHCRVTHQETRIVIDAEPDRIITLTKNRSNNDVDITGKPFVHLSGVFIVREMQGKLSGRRDVGEL